MKGAMKIPKQVSEYFAAMGRKGGKKARHYITPAQQKKMQKARRRSK